MDPTRPPVKPACKQDESIHSIRKEDRHGPSDPASHRISDQSGLLNPHPIHEVPDTMDVGLRGVRNFWPVREAVTDKIQGVTPVEGSESFNLFLPYPDPGAISMNQQKRFALSFHRIKNRMAVSLDRLRRERRVPVNPGWPEQRDPTTPPYRHQQEGNDPPKTNHPEALVNPYRVRRNDGILE